MGLFTQRTQFTFCTKMYTKGRLCASGEQGEGSAGGGSHATPPLPESTAHVASPANKATSQRTGFPASSRSLLPHPALVIQAEPSGPLIPGIAAQKQEQPKLQTSKATGRGRGH